MMKDVLLYFWQLPQNCLGLLLRLFYKGNDSDDKGLVIVRRSLKMQGGISLGRYIIVNQFARDKTLYHEIGHCKQSRMLGPLYLFVIGIPSLIWAGLYGWVIDAKKHSYYDFYTEKWADKLGGVER